MFVGERNSGIDHSTWVGVVHGAIQPVTRIMGTTVRTPNAEDALFEDFSSNHFGGAMFLFGDGAVRWVRNEIELDTYQALSTRHDRNLIKKNDVFR